MKTLRDLLRTADIGTLSVLPPSNGVDAQWHISNDMDTMVLRSFGFGNDGKGAASRNIALLVAAAVNSLPALLDRLDAAEAVAQIVKAHDCAPYMDDKHWCTLCAALNKMRGA